MSVVYLLGWDASTLSLRIWTEFLILEPRLNKVTFSGHNKS